MEPIKIAAFGAEDGSCTVYGSPNAGIWSFWQEGSSMDFDENDDDIWEPWSSEPVPNLLKPCQNGGGACYCCLCIPASKLNSTPPS
jgi:hypothetical protein